ncbi:MAG: hypothetical protein ACRDK2_10110 [Solirubrobacteraceae bacterium]
MSTTPLIRPAAYPPWDGEPYGEVPATAIGEACELLRALIRDDFVCGMDIAHTLDRGIVRQLRAGELVLHPGPGFLLTLWLPELENQRMRAEDPYDSSPVGEPERWQDTELALSCLGSAWPVEPVQLGFVYHEHPYSYRWREYCQRYPHPPHFVQAWWPGEDE